MTTQNQRILEHMRRNRGITALEAVHECGCTRLSARIWDLRAMGYNIEGVYEEGRDRYGNLTKYKRYFLRED